MDQQYTDEIVASPPHAGNGIASQQRFDSHRHAPLLPFLFTVGLWRAARAPSRVFII